MRTLTASILLLLALPLMSIAQESASAPRAVSSKAELGKWWKNSSVVKELQLSETQVKQIEESYLNHRKGLAPIIGELRSHEGRLGALMEADSLNDGEILAQAELVADARARLEKENASMMLSIRKALTVKQWKRLEEIQDLRNTSSALIVTGDAMAISSDSTEATNVAKPSEEKIYSSKDGIQLPLPLYRPMPPYTDEARKARAEGILLLQVVIRKDGSVDSPKVLRGLGYGLDESAIRTIMEEWRFQPGTLNGQPVDVRAKMEIAFRLY